MCIRNCFVGLAALLLAFGGVGQARAEHFDLAADWSDTANPNGVWSYNRASGVPITTHQDPWMWQQPAWADAMPFSRGHIPAWLKSTEDGIVTSGADLPVGRVGLHTSDPWNANLPEGTAGVTWTSPIDGSILVSGGTWLLWKTGESRPQGWRLLDQDGNVVTSGHLTLDDPYTSGNPFVFQETLPVSTGDVITVEGYREGTTGTWVGLDLTITATPVPEPSIIAALSGLLGMGLLIAWLRWKRAA